MAPTNPTVQAGATTNTVEKPITDGTLEKEYIDKRTITISLVHNYSNYRKVNEKVLGQRKETIGSSISSCRVLASNHGEIEAYFPSLIGLSPNNPEFITRVKAWLSNIQVVVNSTDMDLNISFIWNKKSDYLDFKAKEDAIDEEYAKTDRANTSAIKEAVKVRVEALNALESEKYKYGRPLNLEHYLIYRHCLLYKDVAKDIALINSDPSYRFYIKDSVKEAEKQKKMTEEKLKAMQNFIELNGSIKKFDAVYIAMVASRNENITEALIKDKSAKVTILMDFANTNPDKFNKFFNDKNVEVKAFIETLIVRGELRRSDYNQQISTADGEFIGSNMNEAIAYFNNPDNANVKAAYEKKLNLFN